MIVKRKRAPWGRDVWNSLAALSGALLYADGLMHAVGLFMMVEAVLLTLEGMPNFKKEF